MRWRRFPSEQEHPMVRAGKNPQELSALDSCRGVHHGYSCDGGVSMIARLRFLLYSACAISWLVPFKTIEDHVAVTFFFFSMYEFYRGFPRRVEAEPEEVPEKARTPRLPDISFKEDNS